MAERQQVLDGPTRARHVVDVDADDRDVRERALQDDREAVAHQGEERRIVRPRARHDETVGMLRPKERAV